MKVFLKWCLAWAGLTLAITIAGALTGCLLFTAGGHLLDFEMGTREMVWNGIKDGGFYAFIWAPGLSFVICLMLGRSRQVKNADYII